MYRNILKSLLAGYLMTGLGMAILDSSAPLTVTMLFAPLFLWPATLIVSLFAFIVFKAVEEEK